MSRILIAVFLTTLLSGIAAGVLPAISAEKEEPIMEVTTLDDHVVADPIETTVETVETVDTLETSGVVIEDEPVTEDFPISQQDIELIALVTMAEAEGESEYGKRLVIDTILNRMDSEYWPDTVSEVIYQESQFTSVWNGRIDRCYVRNDICQLVKEELINRSNYDVVFFRTQYFSPYGQPLFQEGNHYFSSITY